MTDIPEGNRLNPTFVASMFGRTRMEDYVWRLVNRGQPVNADLRTVMWMVLLGQATLTYLPKTILIERVKAGLHIASRNRVSTAVQRAVDCGFIVDKPGPRGHSYNMELSDGFRLKSGRFKQLHDAVNEVAVEMERNPDDPKAGRHILVSRFGEAVAAYIYWNPRFDETFKAMKSPEAFVKAAKAKARTAAPVPVSQGTAVMLAAALHELNWN